MTLLLPFLISFAFSFVGSIPPATINLTILQLGLERKINIAWRFAAAAALVEYPYAWLAVKFESFITSTPMVVQNFKLITAIVVTTLGILNLWAASRPSSFTSKFNDSGFRRGLILGILNPLAMPFWIGVTAYVESQHWINISTPWRLHSYLLGVSAGGFTLLILLAYIARRIVSNFESSMLLKRIPGFAMLALGCYAFVQYFFF